MCSLTSGYPPGGSAQQNAYIRIAEELMHYTLQQVNFHRGLRSVAKSAKHCACAGESNIKSSELSPIMQECYHPPVI